MVSTYPAFLRACKPSKHWPDSNVLSERNHQEKPHVRFATQEASGQRLGLPRKQWLQQQQKRQKQQQHMQQPPIPACHAPVPQLLDDDCAPVPQTLDDDLRKLFGVSKQQGGNWRRSETEKGNLHTMFDIGSFLRQGCDNIDLNEECSIPTRHTLDQILVAGA
mmetsp:Transcript_99091/g.196421  ORF Transcript_99091/g.196421 Transcript_99091/m.196421 type:complete len:163 (+) Transcript_99091:56-544(+)